MRNTKLQDLFALLEEFETYADAYQSSLLSDAAQAFFLAVKGAATLCIAVRYEGIKLRAVFDNEIVYNDGNWDLPNHSDAEFDRRIDEVAPIAEKSLEELQELLERAVGYREIEELLPHGDFTFERAEVCVATNKK